MYVCLYSCFDFIDYVVLKPSSLSGGKIEHNRIYFIFFFLFFLESTNETYIRFCSMHLDFMEQFILLSRIPFYTIVWHSLFIIENQVSLYF